MALYPKAASVGGSLAWLSGLALAQSLPALAVAPLAGALADRGRRRAVLIAADLGRAGLLCAMAWSGSLPALVGLAALAAALDAVFGPVEATLEADLLAGEEIVRANAVRIWVRQTLSIGGPALGGVVLLRFSPAGALLVDAASYAISALLLVGLPSDPGPAEASEHVSWAGDLRAGFAYLAREPRLRVLFGASAAVIALLGMQGPLLYGFVVQALHADGPAFATLLAGLGAGASLASLGLARWPARSARLTLLAGTLAFDALALLGFTYSRSLPVCTVLMAAMGAISAVFGVTVRAALQTLPPPDFRGRTLGLFAGMQGPLEVASLALAILLAARFSAAAILRGGAVGELLVALASLAALALIRRRSAVVGS